MEHKIATWFCRRLRAKQVIDEEYEEVYVYGLELIFSFLISTCIIMMIGLIFHQVISTLTFLITFVFIRQFTGGYHANSYFMCKICTITCFGLTVFLAHYVTVPKFLFIILLLIGGAVICLLGPIENIHKPLTHRDKKRNKLIGFCLFVIWSMIGLGISSWIQAISNTIFFTLFVIIILMIIPLMERRKDHE